MNRYITFLDWNTQYFQDVYSPQMDSQIQHNPIWTQLWSSDIDELIINLYGIFKIIQWI